MQSKLKFILHFLVINFFVFSCSKKNDPPAPPAPVLTDTLGVGWQRIMADSGVSLTDIFFVNNQTGYLSGVDYLGKSTDGGLTWSKIEGGNLHDAFSNLFFVDANNGWAAGSSALYRTRDAGTSWQKSLRGVYDMQFLNADTGYVVANNGYIYKTTDGGASFQSLNNPDYANSLFFLGLSKGWFYHNNVFKTDNGGQTFSTPIPFAKGNNYIIQFTDSLNGWLTGEGLHRTIDGGNSFETLITDTHGAGDVSFFDANNGFIMTGDGIYSTTDGGKTQNQLSIMHKSTLTEMHATDLNHAWACGSHGYVYRYVKP